MKIIKELAILLAICLLAVLLSSLSPVPLPTSILALALLLVALLAGVLKVHHIENVSSFLLDNMAFLFIPAGVGILKSLPLIQGKTPALLIICLVGTAATFFVAYGTAQLVQFLLEKSRGETK